MLEQCVEQHYELTDESGMEVRLRLVKQEKRTVFNVETGERRETNEAELTTAQAIRLAVYEANNFGAWVHATETFNKLLFTASG